MTDPVVELGGNITEGRCDFALGILLSERPKLFKLFWPEIDVAKVDEIKLSFGVSRESGAATNAGGGESDVQVILIADGQRKLLLIEDKIDAAPQPQQAERYIHFCKMAVEEGRFADARTALFAPKAYGSGSFEGFDAHVTYEALLHSLGAVNSGAAKLAVDALNKGIEKVARATDQTVTDNWTAYIERVAELTPRVAVGGAAKRSAGQTVYTFEHFELAPEFKLRHVSGSGGKKGQVHLERFYRSTGEELALTTLVQAAEMPGLEFRTTEKYGFIGFSTPTFEMSIPAEAQKQAMDEGIKNVQRLQDWALANRKRLFEAIGN